MPFEGLAPNVLNYMVGKGKVWFARDSAEHNNLGELDLGNDPVFSATMENEKLEHYSSMSGVKTKDVSAIISTDMNLKFTLDEINVQNLNLAFLGGDEIRFTNQGDGNINNEALTARLDRYVKLGGTNDDLRRNITAGTVNITNIDASVTFVENTDYTVDYVRGRIFCLSTGAIRQGQALLVDYTYGEIAIPTVNPAERARVEGLLRFVGDTTFGRDYEIIVWRALLSISGDINFISDEWAQLEFTAEALDDSANHPTYIYGKVLDLTGDQAVES